MIDLVLLGAGGTAADVLEIIDAINYRCPTYHCVALLDDDPGKRDTRVADVSVVGPTSLAARWPHARFVDTLGGPASFRQRPESIGALPIGVDRFESIVHPDATVASRSVLGPGCIVYPHVTICANVVLGNHVIVLAHAVINHDCSVGDYAIIASGVCLGGRVSIGRASYVGMASAVIQDAVIGEQALIGMGSVVIRDVPPGSVVVGNPARILR